MKDLRFTPLCILSIAFVFTFYYITHAHMCHSSTLLNWYSGCEIRFHYPTFFSYLFDVEGIVTLTLFIVCGLYIKPLKWGIPASIAAYILLVILCTALWGGDADTYKQHNHPTYLETIKSNDIEAEISF